jgi:hypothetical protein
VAGPLWTSNCNSEIWAFCKLLSIVADPCRQPPPAWLYLSSSRELLSVFGIGAALKRLTLYSFRRSSTMPLAGSVLQHQYWGPVPHNLVENRNNQTPKVTKTGPGGGGLMA